MNAQDIVDRMRNAKKPDELLELIRACGTRRDEIRARQEQLAERSRSATVAPERLTAIHAGPAAVAELDAELVELTREYSYLDDLDWEINTLHQAALSEELRRAFPTAKRRLPAAARTIRDRLKEIDDALAALRQDVETLAQFSRIPGQAFPLDDAELSALLELREAVWTVRTVAVLKPPVGPVDWNSTGVDDKSTGYERSRELYFETGRHPHTVRERQAPRRVHILDIGVDRPPS